MIHYHGLPITPASVAAKVLKGKHALISYRHPEQLAIAVEVCQSWVLDNGAFTAWKSGDPTKDWSAFYKFADDCLKIPTCDWVLIPDVIDGNEKDNDVLLKEFPHKLGVPVYHMHESLGRLERLVHTYERIALGSSGEYATVGDMKWKIRMAQMMNIICDEFGRPKTKLHGLRMLNWRIYTKYPLSSADSCNIGRNIGIDKNWARGSYLPPSKDVRAMVLAEIIENHQSAVTWERNEQLELV